MSGLWPSDLELIWPFEIMPGIEPNYWFNDKIINAYLDMLNFRTKGKNRVCCLNTYTGQIILYQDPNKRKAAVVFQKQLVKAGRAAEDVDFLILPVCIESHWIMYVVDRPNVTVYKLNSLLPKQEEGRSPPADRNYYSIMRWLLMAGYFKEEQEYTERILKHVPQQKNTNDCGLAVCLAARAIHDVKGEDFMFPVFEWGYELQEVSEHLRKRTATELVRN